MSKPKYCQDHYERITELALEVHKLWKGGMGVSYGEILNNLDYKKYTSAAYKKGITWEEVLIAAGVPLDKFKKKQGIREWPRDRYERLTEIALEVHKLWKSGIDTSASTIIHNAEYQKLYSAASGKNIIWQEVLVAAGIPTDEINKKTNVRYKYPRDHYERLTELALKVHKLWKSGLDVSSRAIRDNTEHRKLIGAATWVSISWQEVLVAAGIPLDKVDNHKISRYKYPEDHYERLTVLALKVHKLWKGGVDVSSKAILNNPVHRKLIAAAISCGISWQEVLVAAGIPLDKVMKTYTNRSWPTEHYERLTILALEVHELWKDGVDVSSVAITNNRDYRRLHSAATFIGITWQEVLVAAGIPLNEVMRDIRTRLGYDT